MGAKVECFLRITPIVSFMIYNFLLFMAVYCMKTCAKPPPCICANYVCIGILLSMTRYMPAISCGLPNASDTMPGAARITQE